MSYDPYQMQMATSAACEAIDSVQKRAAKLLLDAEKVKRQENKRCRVCYYASGVQVSGGGQSNCKGCDKPVMRPWSWCKECADARSLCICCGADRELREGRRK